MFSLFFWLSFFWFIRTTKAILFWLYLWQLKEYHFGRFLAHFSTEKGKRLIVNKLLLLKIVLLFCFLFSSVLVGVLGLVVSQPNHFLDFLSTAVFLPLLLLVLYFLESAKALKDFFQKRLKTPIFTKKTESILIFILTLFFILPAPLWQKIQQTSFLYDYPILLRFCFWLLLIDIFTPLIVSLIIFLFQPITVFWRNRIIKKAEKKRKKFKDLLVIGITGSYGKTSTKEILYTILSQKYKVLKTKEHQNSEIGISQCILNDLKPEHQIFICEMGAYNKGGIKLLCDIAKPKIGILTGINEQHLVTFGSQENIIKTKFELIESLPADGIAFFNGKNKYCSELFQKAKVNKKLYGQETDSADAENIAGAVEVAKELGMSEEEITHSKKKIKPWLLVKKACLSARQGINGLNIIDATYSANPNGVISHLDYLKTWQGRKVIVMPCLIELGSASKEIHQRIGRKIGEVCDLAIITTKECFKDIKSGAESGEVGPRPFWAKSDLCKTLLFIEDPKKIFEKIKEFNGDEDIILLESRVPKELIELIL